MPDIQAILRQQLVEETARLVARGGPGAITQAEAVPLHYEPTGWWLWKPPAAGETFYPLAAVLAALPCPDLRTLLADWTRSSDAEGPLPLYLHETVEGHYTAMLPESFILDWLIYMTDMCDAEMLREDAS